MSYAVRTIDIQRKAVKAAARRSPRRTTRRKARGSLTKEQVLRAAIAVADRDGIDGVTMRRLGQELGVEAMSLYHHVTNKDDIVDGMVDLVISEISMPTETKGWRAPLRDRAMTAREHVRRHPWLPRLITSGRGLRPAMLGYMNWFVGVLADAGFSQDLIHSAMHLLGARLFGFNEETFSEGIGPQDVGPLRALLGTGEYQAIARAIKGMHHDDDREFAFGLDLILDGLARASGGARA